MKKKMRQKIKRVLVSGLPTGALAGYASMDKIDEVYDSLSEEQKRIMVMKSMKYNLDSL
jgi:hypothetical protein